ncbi:MAG: hypothetical protein IJP27_02935 [Clostridia bacterium]|nr:hypothetical protein [Clostridia bacterium]
MNNPIFTGAWGRCHIQGIAVDTEKGYLYYSFTTKLIKARLDGTVVGSVDGLMGHLGCIAFNKEDGRVYGSLEYKNDSIGKGILKNLGSEAVLEDAFYIAIFDVDKIDRLEMDAEKDGIMTSVYLKEVVDDYNAPGHRFGCSGIDGTTFAPYPGDTDGKQYLFVAYGIYSDVERSDNDHQVLLCYDIANWHRYEAPLSQLRMHKQGPERPKDKLFVYTGNTTYGVQNLEYDPQKKAFFMAVYPGKKPNFPNFHLFAANAAERPTDGKLALLPLGEHHEATNTYGWRFRHGATGLYSYGNGDWLISHEAICQSGQCSFLYTYVFDEKRGFILKD